MKSKTPYMDHLEETWRGLHDDELTPASAEDFGRFDPALGAPTVTADTDRANLTKLRRLVRDAVNRMAADQDQDSYERIWLERARILLKETVPSEAKRDPARLYFVYESSEPKR